MLLRKNIWRLWHFLWTEHIFWKESPVLDLCNTSSWSCSDYIYTTGMSSREKALYFGIFFYNNLRFCVQQCVTSGFFFIFSVLSGSANACEKTSFIFLRQELPVRMANIMKEIDMLPDKLIGTPSVQLLHSWYVHLILWLSGDFCYLFSAGGLHD